jgi:putative flavoprotein involved in K+ transport
MGVDVAQSGNTEELSVVDTRGVLIIGAGPSGLSLGYELMQFGMTPLLLEAGPSAGWSWSNMPENISLLSPWMANHLQGTRVEFSDVFKMHSCHEFAAYLQEYARLHYLDIAYEVRVERVEKVDGIFFVYTNKGLYKARVLINATGYFHKPNWPAFPGMHDTNVKQIHTSTYKSAEKTAALLGKREGRILVVGGRVSAGQTITELHDGGPDFEVVLSHREPLKFAKDPWMQYAAFAAYYTYEDWRVARDPYYIDDSNPPMEGGRTRYLLQSNKIPQRPNIKCFHKDEVEFLDGTREAFDLVIYATGFHPAIEHLKELAPPTAAGGLPETAQMESRQTRNLFFMGLDMQRSFRSRYLRGIREDAPILARTVRARARERQGGKA